MRQSRCSGVAFDCLLVCPPPACPRCGKKPCTCPAAAYAGETIYSVAAGTARQSTAELLDAFAQLAQEVDACLAKLQRVRPKTQDKAIKETIGTLPMKLAAWKRAGEEQCKAMGVQLDKLETFLKETRDGTRGPTPSAREERALIRWHCPHCGHAPCSCKQVTKTETGARAIPAREGDAPGIAPAPALVSPPRTAATGKDTLTRLKAVPAQLPRVAGYHHGWLLGITARLVAVIEQAQYGDREALRLIRDLRGLYRKQFELLQDDLLKLHTIPPPEPSSAAAAKSRGTRKTPVADDSRSLWHKLCALLPFRAVKGRASKR